MISDLLALAPVAPGKLGHLRITADGQTADLRPGGLIHLPPSITHAVEAVEASRLSLTLLGE